MMIPLKVVFLYYHLFCYTPTFYTTSKCPHAILRITNNTEIK
jgi:hypothetical protein